MGDTTVDSTDMVLDTTVMDTDISARGLLMLNPRLMLPLPLMLTTDTMAVDTVTDMDLDMAVTDTVTLARGPLMPNLKLMPLLMLTTVTTAVDTDTDMAVTMVDTTDTPMVDTVMAVSVTTVRFK